MAATAMPMPNSRPTAPFPAADEPPRQPPGERLVRIGLPVLAGLAIFALGSAYFLQKDRFLAAQQRTETRAAASEAASEISFRLRQAYDTGRAFATLLGHSPATHEVAPAIERLLAVQPVIDAATLVDRNGVVVWHLQRGKAGQPLPAARLDGPLSAIGDAERLFVGDRLRFVQTLHGPRGYFGDAVVELSVERLSQPLAPLTASAIAWALRSEGGRSQSLLAASAAGALASGQPLTLEIAAAGIGESLSLTVGPRAGWQGSPFLPVELALCALAGVLCSLFGIVALRRPTAVAPASGSLPGGEAGQEATESAARVARLSRNFAVLSGIGDAIVRLREPQALYRRACELLVERGGFPFAFAWQRGDDGLEVAAAAGDAPAALLLDKLLACPATCEALGRKVILCEATAGCGNPALFAPLAPRGIHALALLPLHDGRRSGIALAARSGTRFAADETDLLHELSAILSHAFDALAIEAARRAAEDRLRLSAQVFENSSEGIIITDAGNHILMVNRTFEQVTGYAASEVIGRNPRLLSSGKQPPEFYREMWAAIQRCGEWHGEVQNRRKNGEYYAEWLTISVVRNESGEITNYVAVFSDITSKKQIAERLNFLANYDTLTTLPNRVLFTDRLERALTAARAAHHHVAVLALDLDRFNLVNETFGHAAGDSLLKEIARRLSAGVREGDSVSRVGGDEFSIVLADLESPDEATVVAGKIMQALATPLIHDGQEIFASASIGISVFPDDGEDADALVRNANSAMYRAMEEGRNTFRFYHQEMNARSAERMSLQNELRRALERGELVMHYQPFIDSRNGRIVGAEALLRWHRPGIGFVTPSAFIPLLEETGHIVAVGEWVLASALADCQRWHAHGHHDLFVAVNFSAMQFSDADVTRRVADTISRLSANPRHLEIELTESAVMRDPRRGIEALASFREIGTRLSIDDFGTGYSSLSYIKKLPIDTLKIDRSFVIDTPDENEANAIVQAIAAMGHNLGLRIVAEGVQQPAQVDFLRQIRCDLLQGYHFSAALAQAEFLSLLDAGARGESHWLAEPWSDVPSRRLASVRAG
jgi:diguanylate cyclase (GGDEF)-like protein/PAS domain S-box-containing protein